MDPLVRQIENATHQRNDVFRVSNQDGPTSLPNPDAGGPCPTCGQALAANGRRLDVLDAAALPAGVRFDPSDEELLRHLASKVGRVREPPHRLIDDFISHLEGEEGICQTHPEKLPGVKKDGSSRHFFHKPAKAYTTGTRKRRKILNEDDESGVETRWHKTGKTRPVTDGGEQLGWKKIMVLYKNSYSGKKKAKSEKTNWILHQYHLGPHEEERDDELVVCKVFYQKQPRQCTGGRQTETATADVDSSKPETSQAHTRMVMEISTGCGSDASRGTLITPKRDAPHRPQFSPHRSRGVSPPSQVNLEPVAVRTPTQSGRGSDMSLTPCLNNPGSLQSGEVVHCVRVKTRPENCSPDLNEEVSTCARAYENGNALIAVEEPSRDDEYAAQPQVPESEQDLIDIPELLRCTEELDGTAFLPDVWMQSLEPDGIPDEGHTFEGVINPNPDYPFYEDMLTSTPPAISSDMKFSSQEVSAFFSGECEFDLNDNSDSLSST